jgi:hypothetical protein
MSLDRHGLSHDLSVLPGEKKLSFCGIKFFHLIDVSVRYNSDTKLKELRKFLTINGREMRAGGRRPPLRQQRSLRIATKKIMKKHEEA